MNRKQRRAETHRHRRTGGGRIAVATNRAKRQEAANWVERGRALQSAGRIADAIAAFRKAVSACPEAAELHGILAAALRAAGRTSEAIAAYRQGIEIDPSIPALHNNLGNAYLDIGAIDEACAAYRRAAELDPDYADAHGNLGLALREAGRIEEALIASRGAASIAPNRPDIQGNLATVLETAGHLDEAATVLDASIRRSPADARLRCQRARLMVKVGDMAAAESALRDALRIDPICAAAYFELSDIKQFEADDDDLQQMERIAATADELPVPDRIDLHFALAKAREDSGRYDDAFEQLSRGNRLKRDRLAYDSDGQRQLFETIASVFDESLLTRLAGGGNDSTVPVFVVGMPRSGTTLVERMLGSHPQIHGAGELRALSDIARRSSGGGDPVSRTASLAGLDVQQCAAMGRDYIERIAALDANAGRIVDKMPSNFLRIGLISLILPNARIIHCRRDPADTCLSCYKQLFGRGQSFSYDLQDLGRYYVLYLGLMDHWRRVLPGRVYDVDYESLVAEPEDQIRRLLDHCGMPWDPACLRFHADRSPVHTASASQVRRPIYKSSIARWRRYERHLEPLLEILAGRR